MAAEPRAFFTYVCPRDRQPTVLYTADEYRALAWDSPLRPGDRCPNCGALHAFTKVDLRPVDRRRPSRARREAPSQTA